MRQMCVVPADRAGRASRCILIEPGETGSIKIEAVRDVIDRAGYRPFEGRRRVVIIDEADALCPRHRTRC